MRRGWAVEWDEAALEFEAGGVEFFARLGGGPDLGNSIAVYRDIGDYRCAAGTVVYRCRHP